MLQTATSANFERSLWPPLLIAVSAISTLGFACVTPFAAFAVAAAYVLPMRAALFCVVGVWLANQAIGFAAMNYPWALDTLLWGLAIGISAVLATAAASVVLRRTRRSVIVSALAGLTVAFVVYEAGLLLVTFGLGGSEAFTPAIVGQFALLNLAWAAGLVGVRELLRLIANFALPPALARR